MNYRHAFHAGNHADVLKHAALIFCLDRLKQKPAPFGVLDTHAGAGLYDLTSDEARRSPEWQAGIAKLADWPDAPPLIAAYLDAIAAFNPDGTQRLYPGSPALIARALREQDRLASCELHPEDAATLRRNLRSASNVHIHVRDAWEALGALLPLPEKRGLILIDPPYEEDGELARAATAIKAALHRFRQGVYLWWRPLKRASDLDRADAELGHPALRADLWIDAPRAEGKLVGSSILVINPPFGLEDALRAALPALAERLALSPDAGWRLDGP